MANKINPHTKNFGVRVKIAYALPSFAAGGGIEEQLLGQLKVFSAEKYEIHLISLFYVNDRPHLYGKLPPHVTIHIFKFKGYFDFKNYILLFKELKKINPEVLITSMFPANSLFRVLKPFFNYKIITREHNYYTDKNIFHNAAEKLLAPLSDRIVAVSEGVADFFSRQTGIKREKITVINNGIDLAEIQNYKSKLDLEKIKKELGLGEKDKIILNIARLKPQKNHLLLLESFKSFVKENKNYKLFILGMGSEKERLEKVIIDMDLREKAFLMGYRNDAYKFYLISEMFVLASKREGFPNVVLEALAFGVPVITTEVGGVKELIREGENGFVVDGNPAKITEKMAILSKDPSRFKKSCEATAREFDIHKIVNKYEKLYVEVHN